MDNNTQYEERMQLIEDAISLKESHRVPNGVRVSCYPFYEYGVTVAEAMRDYEKAADAYTRFHREFQPDTASSIGALQSSHVLDAFGIKFMRYAGDAKGLDVNSPLQYIEYATLEEDEYDEFFSDPCGFMFRKYLPRCFDVFEPFSEIDCMSVIGGQWPGPMKAFTAPRLVESYKRLIKAAEEMELFRKAAAAYNTNIKEEGFPIISGGGSATAFDLLGDTLRGTFGIMPDLLEQPENVKRAIEYFVDVHINRSLAQFKAGGNKFQWVMLHKGFDHFIGDHTYAEFYWPYLQKWILAMIEAGVTPVVFCEGSYSTRLKHLKDVPKGKVIYLFEEVDIRLAKKTLGDTACIMGGFPLFTVTHGTPEKIRDAVKEHMDVLAPGGGYIFSLSASVDRCPRKNLEALFEAVELFGRH